MFGLWMILIVCIIAAFVFLAATGQLKTGVKGKGASAAAEIKMPDLGNAKKLLVPAAVVVIAGILLSGSFYSVSEDQQAVVTTFGKVTRTDSAGVHFKLPLIHGDPVKILK